MPVRIFIALLLALVLSAVEARAQLTPDGFALPSPLTGNEIVGCQLFASPYITTCTTQQIAALAGHGGTIFSGTPSAGQVPIASGPLLAIWGSLAFSNLPAIGANTVLGSIAGGAAAPLTATQLTTLCNAFTTSLQGCVPSSGGGTTNFLRADATWAPLPASSTVLSVATPAAFSAATIPASVNYVTIQAMSGTIPVTAGQSNCGLTFSRGTGTPTGVYGELLKAGIYWEPMYSTSPVRTCEFGAIGDGTFNTTTNAVTGTDNAPIIQAAVNYGLLNGFSTVCINDGGYALHDTIHLGWGNNIYSMNIVSCAKGEGPIQGAAGVSLYPTQTDRCAINFQANFNSSVRSINLSGANFAFAGALSGLPGPVPTTAAGWFDPTKEPSGYPGGANPGGLQAHTPFGAICIDGFTSPQSTDHYPTKTYPAGLDPGRQYNLSGSSNITIEHVQISGFAVAIVQQPNAQNGGTQGDFLTVRDFRCYYSVYCFSIGGNQARNMEVKDALAIGVFTFATDNAFGSGGLIGGPFINIAVDSAYQGFQIGFLNFVYPLRVAEWYSEGIVRLGTFGGGALNNSVTFDGGTINLGPKGTRISPASLVAATGTGTSFTFNNFGFALGLRIDALVSGPASVMVNGGVFHGADGIAGSGSGGSQIDNAAIAQAVNYTGSILTGSAQALSPVFNPLTWGNPTQVIGRSAPSTQDSERMGTNVYFPTAFRGQLKQSNIGFLDTLNNRQWRFLTAPPSVAVDLSAGAGYATTAAAFTSCDIVTFSIQQAPTDYQSAPFQAYNLAPGDIIYYTGGNAPSNGTDSTVFVVLWVGPAAASKYPVVMQQMNNMTVDTSGNCVTSNVSSATLVGNSTIIHTGIKIPTNVLFGDTNSASTTVSNVQQASGYGAGATGWLVAWPANTIINALWAGGLATFTTMTAHTVPVGEVINISGMNPAGYNGMYITRPGTTGSTIVVDCCVGQGFNGGAFVSGGTLAAGGDKFWSYNQLDPGYNWPWPTGGHIASVTNGTPATMTLTAVPSAVGTVAVPVTTGRFPILPLPVQ